MIGRLHCPAWPINKMDYNGRGAIREDEMESKGMMISWMMAR